MPRHQTRGMSIFGELPGAALGVTGGRRPSLLQDMLSFQQRRGSRRMSLQDQITNKLKRDRRKRSLDLASAQALAEQDEEEEEGHSEGRS